MAEALRIGQHHANTLLGLQTHERAGKIEARSRQIGGRGVVGLRLGKLCLGRLQTIGRPPRLLQPDIDGDGAQPASKGAGRLQPAELAPGLDERLLGQVLGEGAVAAEPAHQFAHHALATANQLGEGLVVARGGQGDHARLSRSGERLGGHPRLAPSRPPTKAAEISSPTPIMPTNEPTPSIG